MCLALAAFEAIEIDRVGFYRHPTRQDLAEPGPRHPIVRVIEQEDIGARLAAWRSQRKHTALMQARAWFTRGLVFLLAAGIVAAVFWAIDASDDARASQPTDEPAVYSSAQGLAGTYFRSNRSCRLWRAPPGQESSAAPERHAVPDWTLLTTLMTG